MSRAEGDRDETSKPSLPDCGDAIDPNTFEQILEMDDDDGREFSHEIVFGFFEQATTTFAQMDEKLEEEDLGELSSLGHYLKGSSATLGLNKVRDHCEKIQHLGRLEDESGNPGVYDRSTCRDKLAAILPKLKADYADAEKRLKAFYTHFPLA